MCGSGKSPGCPSGLLLVKDLLQHQQISVYTRADSKSLTITGPLCLAVSLSSNLRRWLCRMGPGDAGCHAHIINPTPLTASCACNCSFSFSLTTKNTVLLIFFFFCPFRAAPVAHGGSQARGLIGAIVRHSHSNARSELHL